MGSVTATFGNNLLVGVSETRSGDTAEVFPAFHNFVQRVTLERGPAQMESGAGYQSFTWQDGDTRLSATYVTGDTAGRPTERGTVTYQYYGPGFEQELDRRIAPYIAEAEARRREWLTERLAGSRWQTVFFSDSLAVSFDPARMRRSGAGLEVWQRWDHRVGARERGQPYDVDARVWLVDLDCSGLRWRLKAITLYLGSRVQDSFEISEPSWDRIFPESIGEDVLNSICAAARRR